MALSAPSLWVLVALAGLSVSVCAWVLLKMLALEAQIKTQRRDLTELQSKLDVSLSGAVGMGKRVVNLEKHLRTLQREKQQQNDSADTFSYGQALQMLEQGADVEAVASNCGFSNSEAQLMQLIQQHFNEKSI